MDPLIGPECGVEVMGFLKASSVDHWGPFVSTFRKDLQSGTAVNH